MAPNRPFIVDPVLTAVAIGYRNPAHTLIADLVLPRIPVGGEKFNWTKYPISEGFTVPDDAVGRTSRPNQVRFSGFRETSETEDRGLDDPIPNSDIKAAAEMRAKGLGTFDPEARAVEMLENYKQLNREIRVSRLVFNPATYAAGRKIVLSGSSRFSDYANSDPIEVIKAALEGTLVFRPNMLVLGQPVWSKLSSHPAIVNAIRGNLTTKGIVTKEEFARLFEVQRVLVGESMLNTARLGQDVSLARVWGKHMAALYIDPAVTAESGITFGFTAQYGGKVAGRIEDPDVGLHGGQRIRNGESVKELVAAPDVGYLIQDAVA